MKFLLEIPIQDSNTFTSIKIVEDEINYIEKGEWDDNYQDWQAIVVLKTGERFKVFIPIYSKLIAFKT